METMMTKLKQLLPSTDPEKFLQSLAQLQITEYEKYFIFSTPRQERLFFESITYLASPETFSFDQLQLKSENPWKLICQTIDGDYLLARKEETMVLPVSLYKTDIEIYPYTIVDFFIAYDNGEIPSRILATK